MKLTALLLCTQPPRRRLPCSRINLRFQNSLHWAPSDGARQDTSGQQCVTRCVRGKTRGDGSEQPADDDGPLDIDAAIDECLKAAASSTRSARTSTRHWEKTTRRRPEEMKVGELTAELDLRGKN